MLDTTGNFTNLVHFFSLVQLQLLYIDHRYTIMKTEPWKIIDISKTLLINSELLTRFSGWIAPTNWAIHDTPTTTTSNNKELSIIQEARQGRARLVFRRRGVLELSLSL